MAKTSEIRALIDAFMLFAFFQTLLNIDSEIIVHSDNIKGEEQTFFELHNMPIAPNRLNEEHPD